MPDVVDFLVLRQSFDVAIQRDWKVGEYMYIVLSLCAAFKCHVVHFYRTKSNEITCNIYLRKKCK